MRNVSFNIAKCILLLWTAIVLHEGQAQSQPKPKVVQLGCESPKFGFVTNNPFYALATAVTRNKKASRFRVTWNAVLGSGWNNGTMLYDRQRNLLKYYDTGGQGYGAWFYRKSYLFTGIKDTTLIYIADTYDNEQGIEKIYPTAFIHLLPKLGYRRYKLIDMERWDASKK